MHALLRQIALALMLALPFALAMTPALAHETRTVGSYGFKVGRDVEPPLEGQPNAVQLMLTDSKQNPVSGADKTLNVDVTYAPTKATKAFDLTESDETPGLYRASFIPTSPGAYAFHFTGTINGAKVDQTFSSGPNAFDDVISQADMQFPAVVPSGRELSSAVTGATTTAQTAQSAASKAKTLAIVALAVAVVLGGGALALGMRKK